MPTVENNSPAIPPPRSNADRPLRIGLYGGSFDPIHFGHLLPARDAMEQLGLHRLIFLPASISPHKLDQPPSPPADRLAMLRAAIDGVAGFEVDDRELRRAGPSFTIDTVREIHEEFPACELYYLIGDDNLEELHTWKCIEELKELARFVVMERHGASSDCGFPCVTRRIEISATEIRNRVAAGRCVRYMIPVLVNEIIESRGLYRG